ncbi:MAG TPA: hypothetical protein PKC98_10095, partial [Candidatus Melainabacteria bacterium]|nr:hypothetical protein [Candidatus Melainabacteria bacterium]
CNHPVIKGAGQSLFLKDGKLINQGKILFLQIREWEPAFNSLSEHNTHEDSDAAGSTGTLCPQLHVPEPGLNLHHQFSIDSEMLFTKS